MRNKKTDLRFKPGNGKKCSTGVADAVRMEMKAASAPISLKTLYARLDISPGDEKQRVHYAVKDFLKRGELIKTTAGYLKYNHEWKRVNSFPVRDRIFKAISISSLFTSTDIRKLVKGARQNNVERNIRKLVEEGHLKIEGKSTANNKTGWSYVYRVVDRIKFRMEVMK